ncbi:hypothetical protein DL89DRAFT_270165 [Linderina pennispora]|uniref:Uncharacterized protein n=1 Tax=Linderina pennispora TaxID=61395 RepID=A0A1Y1VZD4_9FUNG|nr:uncharacterized protein DL89DRAFT_270165 [Linderina pennispora]ORX66637.1 hypothetical protein DL89DRAFT_270165 [Linderina pennispora]
MQINYPCPRFSPHCATTPVLPPGESLNYNLASPIGSGGDILAPLCHSQTAWPQVNEKWTAGQSITVKFAQGGAAHGGGHCEFSLSYDGGKTFVVIHQELKYCFVGSASSSNTANTLSYTFNLPSDLPGTDHAVFAWSWVNAVGNREFYMDCADVSISGSSKSFTGKEMTIANYGSNYPTIGEFNGNYDTGLDVYSKAKQITVTGNGSSSGSPGASSSSASYTASTASTSAAPATTATTTGLSTRAGHTPATSPSPASSAPATSAAPASTSAAPAPTSAAPPSDGSCSGNEYKCSSDGKGFLQCIDGAWSSTIYCPSSTTCFQDGTSIYCGFPQ